MPPRKLPKPAASRQSASQRLAANPRKRGDEAVEAAATVFAERGYHGATTQEIADQLNIRQATLYYYFASKEAALELVCQRGVEGFIEKAEAVAKSSDSPPEKIARIIRDHLQSLDEKHSYVKVFLNERQHLQDAARKKIGRLSRRYELIIQQIFETGSASGMMRADLNCRLATLALLGVCNAAVDWYGKEPGATLTALEKNFVKIILNGVGSLPGAVAGAGGRRSRTFP